MIGKTISHYKILEKLGEGGMGVVYKADDLILERPVALKFLYASIAGEAEGRSRFIREARAAAALDHPNITTVYDVGETDTGELFIAMAYVEGQTLKQKIRSAPLPVDEALDVAVDVARGLQEAHDKGIVHRDVKSSNIMVTPEGQAKVADFGLARFRGEITITKTGAQMGTARYMSPEQIQGLPADHQSDLFSFGVVLFEALTGELPFRGEIDQAVMYSILYDQPPPVRELRAEVSPALEQIVDKALKKDKAQRYHHTGELLADLQALKEDRTSGQVALTPEAEGKGKKTPFVYGGVAVLLLALGYGLLQLFAGGRTDAIDSIAVLPLANLSGNAEQEYFVAGMQEALISDLSKINALKVVSRTSTRRYKETDKAIPEIARELGVDALLQGAVLHVGDTVRISVQLIHGATDDHVWEGTYDRDLRDVLGLISEVAQDAVDEIAVVLTPEEEARLARVYPVNPEAHAAYLRGRYLLYQLTQESLQKSLPHFQEAIAIDSSFALGWSGLASAYSLLVYLGNAPGRETMELAKAAALKAITLDDQAAIAHMALGWVYLFEWEWAEAEKAFQRALELNPNDVDALHGYADYLTVTGRPEEGLVHVKRSWENDRFSPMYGLSVVAHLYMMRRYDDAVAEIQKLLDLDANYRIQGRLASVYWQQGRFEEALAAYRNAWAGDPERLEALEEGFAGAGPAGAMRAVGELLARRAQERYVNPFTIALAFSSAGDDEAFVWLEKAYEEQTPELIYVPVRPEFDPVRHNPRFGDLLRRMGLPEAGSPGTL